MKKLNLVTLFLCLYCAYAVCQEENANEYTDEIKAANHVQDMTDAEMMEKWMEMNTLGDEHKAMSETVGKYTYKMQSWMSPDSEPMISEGTTEVRPIMEGRYIIEEHQGMSMGLPFHGMAIQGYDKVEKQYVTTWIDNMGTGIVMFKGRKSLTGNMTSFANYNNPMTGHMEKHKIVITPGEGGHSMDYYVTQASSDENVQMLHVDYTKVVEEELIEEEIEIAKEKVMIEEEIKEEGIKVKKEIKTGIEKEPNKSYEKE